VSTVKPLGLAQLTWPTWQTIYLRQLHVGQRARSKVTSIAGVSQRAAHRLLTCRACGIGLDLKARFGLAQTPGGLAAAVD
jgi:hypothetical protein